LLEREAAIDRRGHARLREDVGERAQRMRLHEAHQHRHPLLQEHRPQRCAQTPPDAAEEAAAAFTAAEHQRTPRREGLAQHAQPPVAREVEDHVEAAIGGQRQSGVVDDRGGAE
jgi:hypothetical protein